jgi:hypothetical protein
VVPGFFVCYSVLMPVTTTAAPGANAPLTAAGPIRALRARVPFF